MVWSMSLAMFAIICSFISLSYLNHMIIEFI